MLSFLNNCSQLVQSDCVLCGAPTAQGQVCPRCGAALPVSSGGCPVCAGPGEDRICGDCLREPPPYTRCIAALRYEFPADELIQALKYRGALALAPILAEWLARAVAHAPRPDLIIPMPLFPARARARGFNQATEIARPLAHRLGVRLDTTSLSRIRDTAPQAQLSLPERRRNVRDAFACARTVAGLHVALVDDVMTSGATLREAARALKRAGAAEISLWVVARALPRK
ncbi:ComF family protein [Thiobacter aerophilum]|uniref:ComF family protein n=1 Tax=Thiobacter aerophilum TaxID=3121275 RepID=A0ABV0EEK7_9BURK